MWCSASAGPQHPIYAGAVVAKAVKAYLGWHWEGV